MGTTAEHYGIRDVCLSLPAIVDRSGIRRVLPIPLADDEVERLRNSAAAVSTAMTAAGFGEEQPALLKPAPDA